MLQQVNKFACCLLDWNSIEDGAGQQNRGPKNLCDHMVRVRLAHPSLGEDCVLPQGETRFRLRIYILLNLSPYKGGGGGKMEHVNIHHMHPVKFGKSYFLSRDVIKVSNLITQTIKKKKNLVWKRKFPYQTNTYT